MTVIKGGNVMAKARVAVMLSGTGTTMASLLYASRMPDCPYEIVLVASNKPEARGLAVAAAEGIPTFAHSHKGLTREAHEAIMREALAKSRADHVALCGYMRILTPDFVARWDGRMLNTHPSLLPKYRGLETHQRALDAKETHGGCTVHLVTAELDDGPILGQIPVAILPGDTAESLAQRVLYAEYQLYPRALASYVARERDPDWLAAQVRERALLLPEADEVLSHGMPCFGIKGGKKFAYVSLDHHGDGKTALLVKISGQEEQEFLIESDEERYYRPAYFGDGWIGIRLDLGDTDWDGIADWLAKSWRATAPRKLTKMLDVMDDF
jgi:phosphoribosylglycinamide formyltransferase-1